jgi:hypothetical protein
MNLWQKTEADLEELNLPILKNNQYKCYAANQL